MILRAVSVGALPLCTRSWHANALAVVQGSTLPLIGISNRVCLVRVFGKECAAALNFSMACFGLASIAAPLLYAALDAAFPSRGFDLTIAAACAAYVVLALVTACARAPPPEDDQPEESRGGGVASEEEEEEEEEEVRAPPDDVVAPGPGWGVSAAPRDRGNVVRGQVGVSALPPAPRVELAAMVMYMVFSVAVEVTYASWIFVLAEQRVGFSPGPAAELVSAMWGAFTATRFGLATLPRGRVSPLAVVLASYAVTAAALGVLVADWTGALPDFGRARRPSQGLKTVTRSMASGAVTWGAILGVPVGTAGLFPNGIALGREMFHLAGMTQALFELGASTGAGVGPWLGAWAYRHAGGDAVAVPLTCAGAAGGALAALAVAVTANAGRRKKRRRLGAEEERTRAAAATALDEDDVQVDVVVDGTGTRLWVGAGGEGESILRQPLLRKNRNRVDDE